MKLHEFCQYKNCPNFIINGEKHYYCQYVKDWSGNSMFDQAKQMTCALNNDYDKCVYWDDLKVIVELNIL